MNEVPMQPTPMPTPGQPAPVVSLPAPGQQTVPVPPLSAPLSDGDPVDEAAWIDAARQVIASTQNDPYLQTEQLYKLRVQFMKRIHQRDLKQKETDA